MQDLTWQQLPQRRPRTRAAVAAAQEEAVVQGEQLWQLAIEQIKEIGESLGPDKSLQINPPGEGGRLATQDQN